MGISDYLIGSDRGFLIVVIHFHFTFYQYDGCYSVVFVGGDIKRCAQNFYIEILCLNEEWTFGVLGYFQVNLSFYKNFSFVFIEVGRLNNMTSGIDIHRCSV